MGPDKSACTGKQLIKFYKQRNSNDSALVNAIVFCVKAQRLCCRSDSLACRCSFGFDASSVADCGEIIVKLFMAESKAKQIMGESCSMSAFLHYSKCLLEGPRVGLRGIHQRKNCKNC